MSASRHVAQFAVVLAAHLMLLGALLAYQPTRQVMVQIIPVVARIIPPERLRWMRGTVTFTSRGGTFRERTFACWTT